MIDALDRSQRPLERFNDFPHGNSIRRACEHIAAPLAPDIFYRQLFMANDREKIERILQPIGIDLTKTSLTRFNGAIAYRIGGKEPDSPKLIIEKKRFLPLLLIYRIPDKDDTEVITVKFEDYQKKDKGWYPFEI